MSGGPHSGRRRAIIAVVVAIVCGTLVAISVHVSLLRSARADAARVSQVTATIVEPAVPEHARSAIGQWTSPDGTLHIGEIPALPGHVAGQSHPVWINETGQITTAPKSPLHRGAQTLLAGTAVAVAIIFLTRARPRHDHAIGLAWQEKVKANGGKRRDL